MVVFEELHQGDILFVERIRDPILVVSKDFFNRNGEIIGCPILKNSTVSPLHIFIIVNEFRGYAQCEKLALLDLKVRGYKKVGRIQLMDRIEISDVVQGIFEYV